MRLPFINLAPVTSGLLTKRAHSISSQDAVTIALWSIFLFFLVLEAGVNGVIISRAPDGHRRPYWLLLLTVVLAIIASILNLVYTVQSAEADILLGDEVPALLGIGSFFFNWSTATTYWVMVMLIWDRDRALSKAKSTGYSRSIIPTIIHSGLFVAMLLTGTISAALYVAFERKFWAIFKSPVVISELLKLQTHWLNSSYVFFAFTAVTAIDIIVMVVILARSYRTARLKDDITKIFIWVITPLYFLNNLASVIYTIVLAPGILSSGVNTVPIYNSEIAIVNFTFAAVLAGILYTTWNRKHWELKDGNNLPLSPPLSPFVVHDPSRDQDPSQDQDHKSPMSPHFPDRLQ